VLLRDIADVIGRGLKVPVVSKSREEASEHFGFLEFFVGADGPASSAQTQEGLGWRPTGPGLISDLENMRYLPASLRSKGEEATLRAIVAIKPSKSESIDIKVPRRRM
jgi:hypothetical protein